MVAVPRAPINSSVCYYPVANLPLSALWQVDMLLILLCFSMYKTGGKTTCFAFRNTGRIRSLLQRVYKWKVQQNFYPTSVNGSSATDFHKVKVFITYICCLVKELNCTNLQLLFEVLVGFYSFSSDFLGVNFSLLDLC